MTGVLVLGCAGGSAAADQGPLERAMALADSGENAPAIALFDEVIRSHPDSAAPYWGRGMALQREGKYPEALQDLDRAIQLKPDFASAFNSRGFLRQLQGEHELAIADFDSSIRLRPDRPTAIINRGRTEFYLGRFQAAAVDLRRGIQSDAANAYTAIWLHLALRRLGQADTTEFAEAIKRVPSTPWSARLARFYTGELSANGLLASAADPDSSAARNQRCAAAFYIGESLIWAGKIQEALGLFRETKADCPRTFSEYQGAVAELSRLPEKSQAPEK